MKLGIIGTAAACFQFVALLFLAGIGGNLFSILVPFRVQAGTMKPTKMPGLAIFAVVLCQMAFPLILAPACLPPLIELICRKLGVPAAVPINLVLSFLLACVSGLIYWQTLTPFGRLLQRRETLILSKVTSEVE
jgi:hypothetical protein